MSDWEEYSESEPETASKPSILNKHVAKADVKEDSGKKNGKKDSTAAAAAKKGGKKKNDNMNIRSFFGKRDE